MIQNTETSQNISWFFTQWFIWNIHFKCIYDYNVCVACTYNFCDQKYSTMA